ncbi:MAG: hypothetical protein RLZZ362_2550 [Actinomycetota bacterium]|jgi:cell division septum initiation protein DivIVA
MNGMNGMNPEFEGSGDTDWSAALDNLTTSFADGLNGHAAEDVDEDLLAERDRLLAEISAAEARTSAAEARLNDVSAMLRDEVASARDRLSAIDREHEEQMEALRTKARADDDRIMAEARERVDRIMEQVRPLREAAVNDDGQ